MEGTTTSKAVSYTHLRVDMDLVYRAFNIDGEKIRRQMEEEKRQIREESDQLRRKMEEGFAKLHCGEPDKEGGTRIQDGFYNLTAWRREEEMDYHNQRWANERNRKEAFERELRNNQIRRNEEVFYSQTARREEEETRRQNQRWEEERKRREAFEEELKLSLIHI